MSFCEENSNQVQEGHDDAAHCRSLWAAVLAEQLRLASLERPTNFDRDLDIKTARRWIGSKDFHIVCALAGFDGVAVQERLEVLL